MTLTAAEAQEIELLVDRLEEAALDAQRLLTADDMGWAELAGDAPVITRETVMKVSAVARLRVLVDPLLRRGVSLRVSYLASPDVSIADAEGGQDLNAVLQAFWDDPSNQKTFSSPQAVAARERARATDGNLFVALITDPLTGRVRVRKIPAQQIRDIVTDPEDTETVWYYRREWAAQSVTMTGTGARVAAAARAAYYPALGWRPSARPRTIDGIPVEWDKPVIHHAVNVPEGSHWGTPDVLAAIPWAAGMKDFLEDWAKLHKALATVAFRATAKTRKGAAQVREAFATAAATEGVVGGVAVTGEGQTFEAVSKSGATIDAGSSRPLAAMVAAALDLPVTMLLSDPGVTGARATAETLDRPLELDRLARRALDADIIRQVVEHVIREAVRAPRGPLSGTVTRDPWTGEETVTLTGGEPVSVAVSWPPLDKINPVDVVSAIVAADQADRIDPLTVARLLLVALGVEDINAELDKITDAEGLFVPPSAALADRAALNGVAAGDPPA